MVKFYVFVLHAQSYILLKVVCWKTMTLSPEISTFVVVLKKGEENMCLYLLALHRDWFSHIHKISKHSVSGAASCKAS